MICVELFKILGTLQNLSYIIELLKIICHINLAPFIIQTISVHKDINNIDAKNIFMIQTKPFSHFVKSNTLEPSLTVFILNLPWKMFGHLLGQCTRIIS